MQKFIDNNDGTITDKSTGLDWSNTIAAYATLEEAEKAVADMGDGWRLPTVAELNSLVDRSRYEPAINTDFFPDTKNDGYWTSEACAWNKSARWLINFDGGHVGNGGGDRWCVRLCRPAS